MPIASFLSVLPRRLLVSLLLLTSVHSQAFTLGNVQGAPVIGRALDLSVPVQLDPNETVTSACFEADVFHGDSRQDPSGVSVRLEQTASPSSALVRIVSRSRIDEPIVTVYLRAGCTQMVSRRYSLLADIASEPAAPPISRVVAVPLVEPVSSTSERVATRAGGSAAPVAANVARPNASARSVPPTRSRSLATRRTKPGQSKHGTPVRATPAAAAPRPAASAGEAGLAPPAASRGGSGQSRLRLDPLEVLSERVATLESNASAAPTQPIERDAREAERLDRLEASVKALLALAQRNEASLQDVRARIEAVQADRWSSTVTTVLFGLLLLSLLAIVYLLTRMSRRSERDAGRWFDARQQMSDPDSVPPQPTAGSAPASLKEAAPMPESVAAPASRPSPLEQTERLPGEPTLPIGQDGRVRAAGAGNAQVDVSLIEMSESTFGRLMQSGAAHGTVIQVRETVPMGSAQPVAPVAEAAASRNPRIDADESIDIRQRAEFFVTLGQTDQAVQLLEARIAADPASCPQVHLDLLKLFHSLGLSADFDQVAEQFTQLFNTAVPDFAHVDAEGRALEQYPGAVDRLIAAWHRPTVLGTIEQMVYRKLAGEASLGAFDLAAFRDLLMLHAVAQAVWGHDGARAGVGIEPAVAAGSGSAVDIDLSELFAWPAVPAVGTPGDAARASPASTVAATGAGSSGNLIDFDLSEVEVPGNPHQGV